ncbi:MAG: hypothetical protein O3B43_06900 [Chloroflexi bacterium]|nr:hypothetical protein [Chloroflexota bacterium]
MQTGAKSAKEDAGDRAHLQVPGEEVQGTPAINGAHSSQRHASPTAVMLS